MRDSVVVIFAHIHVYVLSCESTYVHVTVFAYALLRAGDFARASLAL